MEIKENNEFIGKKLLEPRAKIDPKFYEYAALYTALYQSIYGSFEDYGFTDRAAVDIFITAKIKTMVTVVDKILKANPNASYDKLMHITREDFTSGRLVMPRLSSSDSHFADEKAAFEQIIDNNWIGSYFPLLKGKKTLEEVDPATGAITRREETVVGNNNYASEYLKNFDRSLAIAQDLTSKLGDRSKSGNMMSVDDARHMLKAEQMQLTELFEGYRAASEGQPFKFDKESKGYKSGAYYEAYRGAGSDSAINKLKEKNSFIRRSWVKFLLKSVGLAAVGAVTVASAAMLLSVGGITLSSVFGTAFAGMGVGSAVTGGLGTLLGGTIFTRLGSSWVKEIGSLYGKYKDKNHFMNGIGKYTTKDGKPQGFKKLREQYYTALGLKDYFIHGDMSKLHRLSRKYVKKYLKENPGLLKNKHFYNYVDGQDGTFQTLYRKLNNVVQAVPENPGRRKWTNDITREIRTTLKSGTTDFDELIKTAKHLEDYKNEIGDVNTHEFQVALASSFDNAFKENIYNEPYSRFTLQVGNRKDVKEVKDALEHSADGGASKRIDANLTFLKTVKTPYMEAQRPLKLDTTLGVSIAQQVDLKENVITAACERLCDNLTAAEKTKVRSIASKLENMQTIDESTAIATELATLTRTTPDSSFDGAKNYLKKMLDKRMSTSKYLASHVQDAITAAAGTTASAAVISNVSSMIENLKRNKEGEFETTGKKGVSSIRETIMDSSNGFSDAQRKAALDMLDKQVTAIENREFLQTEANIIPVMEEGRFNALPDIMKFIDELKFEDISSAKLNDWYTDKIARNSNKPFLDVQLKGKLESLIMSEAESEKYKKKDQSTLDEIVKFIKSVKACVRLDEAQKTRIINSMQNNIREAVKIKIDLVKLNFAEKYDDSELRKLIDKRTGDLKDFFALETPESKQIRNEILELTQLSNLKTMITANINGVGQNLAEEVKEANAFSTVYMFNGTGVTRGVGDGLYDAISQMYNYARNTEVDSLKVSARTFTGGSWGPRVVPAYINDMQNVYNNIISMTDPREIYAALIVFKKRCLAMFKAHVNAYHGKVIQPTGMDAQTYFNQPDSKENFIKQVYESWVYDDGTEKGILNQVDDALAAVSGVLASEPKLQDEEYYFASAVESAKKSYGLTTAAQYRTSPQM